MIVGAILAILLLFVVRDLRFFIPSVYTCLGPKYADFGSRAWRSEYWWFMLFRMLIVIGIGIVTGILGLPAAVANGLSSLFSLAMLLPGVAVTARRLHDVNRSGWWQLIVITIIGIIPLLYWLCVEGDEQPNQYGSNV